MGVLPPQMVYTIFFHRKSKSVDWYGVAYAPMNLPTIKSGESYKYLGVWINIELD